MYHRRNHKKEVVRRTFVYAIMTITTFVLLFILMFRMLGYRLDLTRHTIEQTGLVQYDSFPRSALVSVDGMNLEVTRTKNTVLPGPHTFRMTLKGYQSWQKNMTIKSDTVTQLNYARLIPEQKKVSTMHEFAQLSAVKFAPAGQYVLGISAQHAAPAAVWGDLRDVKNPKFTSQALDKSVVKGYDHAETTHAFVISEWDTSGRFALVKHTYTTKEQADAAASKQTTATGSVQWLRLDREHPTELVDVTQVVGLDVQYASFSGTNGNDMYILQSNGDVRSVRVADATISRPLIQGVQSFTMYGNDTLAYVAAAQDGHRDAGVWKKGWKTPQVIRTLSAAESAPVHIRVSHYFHKDTVVVSVGAHVTIYRGKLPEDREALQRFLKNSRTFDFGRPVAKMTMSNNGRFIVVNDQTGYMSYDIERLSRSSYISLPNGTPLTWLDEFHLWHVDQSGSLVMQEFDGANRSQLTPATAGLDAVLSRDEKYIFVLLKSAGAETVKLQRLSMTINE